MAELRKPPRAKDPGHGALCAIYTRKSSEAGLEQDFNSLDAQREACEAYIASQKHEGWIALAHLLRRWRCLRRHPGAARRCNACSPMSKKIGRIDTIVVYKVDRLTRTLS